MEEAEREFSEEEYPHADVSEKIIGAAIEVHRVLGPGFKESIYENSLAREFDLRGIEYVRQFHVKVEYKDVKAGTHRLDFLVEGKVAVDTKAISQLIAVHERQMISSVRSANVHVGLLVNFNVPRLVDGMKRVVVR